MASYLGNQIILGALEYTEVIAKKPNLKDGIDAYLTEKSREDLIVG